MYSNIRPHSSCFCIILYGEKYSKTLRYAMLAWYMLSSVSACLSVLLSVEVLSEWLNVASCKQCHTVTLGH